MKQKITLEYDNGDDLARDLWLANFLALLIRQVAPDATVTVHGEQPNAEGLNAWWDTAKGVPWSEDDDPQKDIVKSA